MNLYQISNARSGICFGTYEGETEQDALNAMARSSGYADYIQAQEVAPVGEGELIVTKVIDAIATRSNGTPIVIADTAEEAVALYRAFVVDFLADGETDTPSFYANPANPFDNTDLRMLGTQWPAFYEAYVASRLFEIAC